MGLRVPTFIAVVFLVCHNGVAGVVKIWRRGVRCLRRMRRR